MVPVDSGLVIGGGVEDARLQKHKEKGRPRRCGVLTARFTETLHFSVSPSTTRSRSPVSLAAAVLRPWVSYNARAAGTLHAFGRSRQRPSGRRACCWACPAP